MSLMHGRWRRRLSLLASGVLDGPERDATLEHMERCRPCREDLASLRALLDLVAVDPVRKAEPPIPLGALITRVQARLDQEAPPAARRWVFWPVAAGAAVAAAAVATALLTWRPEPVPSIVVSDETLERLERNMAREQAARYLSEAQDVLVTLAAAQDNCDREKDRVDVGEEARRSRELLARRALLVEMDRIEVASARPVLEDVEQVLREVASLESCVRLREVERVQEDLSRRHLLMKIRLMTRELQG